MRRGQSHAQALQQPEQRQIQHQTGKAHNAEARKVAQRQPRAAKRRQAAHEKPLHPRVHFRCAGIPVVELDRDFLHPWLRSGSNQDFEQHLVSGLDRFKLGDARAPDGKKTRHRIANRRKRPGEQRRGA